MDDMISRQAAIETVRKAKSIGQAHRMLVQLPSAQPTGTKTVQVDDCISRAAVVDAIEGVDWYHQNDSGEMVHGANSAEHQAWYKAEDIYKAIEGVPSAQPTLYGYDIKHLAFVASIMAKKGVSPEEAVAIFRDVNRVIEMMLEDMKEMQENALKQTLKKPWEGEQDE